ncbi:MAG: fasciclin domain-containing protein [Methanoculleus sp.]
MPIAGILATDGNHSTFARALDASRLERLLAGPGPYTVFVPSEGAFNRLPPGMLDGLMEDPKGNLAEILLYHMVPGKYQISGSETIATVQGSPITVDAADDGVTVNGAEVVGNGTSAANGVIYTISGVLIPPDIVLPAVGEIE